MYINDRISKLCVKHYEDYINFPSRWQVLVIFRKVEDDLRAQVDLGKIVIKAKTWSMITDHAQTELPSACLVKNLSCMFEIRFDFWILSILLVDGLRQIFAILLLSMKPSYPTFSVSGFHN